MSQQRCLVTVVGSRNQVDLAVPADAPIAEYADLLAELCGQETDEALPPVWSLSLTGAPPLPLTTSLADAGVLDGQVLYLRDVLAGEDDEPVVRSVWEIVSDLGRTGRGPRWDSRARGRAAMLLGAGWLFVVLAYLAVTGHSDAAVGSLAAVTGVALAIAARLLKPYPRVLPRGLRTALACGAVPGMVMAAVLIPHSPGWHSQHPVNALLGALIGLVIALAAVPGVLLAAVTLLVALATAMTALVVALDASPAAAAGTVAVTGILFLAIAPNVAGMLTAVSWLRMSSPSVQPPADTDHLAGRVTLARRTLILLMAAASTAIAIALPVLARDAGLFSFALAAVATVALFLRAGTFDFTTEAIGPLVAGLAGSFGLLTAFARWSVTSGLVVPVMVLAGVVAIGVGLPVLLWGAGTPDDEDAEHRRRFSALLTTCQVALPTLLLGVYGVFGLLWGLGKQM